MVFSEAEIERVVEPPKGQVLAAAVVAPIQKRAVIGGFINRFASHHDLGGPYPQGYRHEQDASVKMACARISKPIKGPAIP